MPRLNEELTRLCAADAEAREQGQQKELAAIVAYARSRGEQQMEASRTSSSELHATAAALIGSAILAFANEIERCEHRKEGM